jgi:hypothetical protein
MDTILDPVTDVQDRVIELLGNLKKPVTDTVGAVVEMIVDRVPEVPALPYAEKLPTPIELIDNQAKFATKVVSTSKSIATSAAKAAAPLTDQLLDRPSAPVKVAKKATATIHAA